MSFLSGLFGSNDTPPPPTPAPAAPTISSGQVEAADREQRSRLTRRAGTDSTILTQGLGDTSRTSNGTNNQASQVARTTALGGNTPLS